MALLDKDRPRGLRVPSLSAIKAFNSKNKSADSPQLKEQPPLPPIQIPAPSTFSPRSDSIPVRPPRPLEKELPPNPLPSPPPQPAAVVNSPAPPAPISKAGPDLVVNQPIRNPPPRHVPAPAPAPAPIPAPVRPPAPTPVSRPIPAPKPIPQRPIPQRPTPQRPIPRAAQPPVSPVAVQQRTPPSSEGEPEQRHSNGTDDSLDVYIPEPEPELDAGSSGPNEAGSSEEDDRPWTPPEVEPVVVPLNNLHYKCYQDHRAMHKANNVWYALPCMTCHKFDRELRRRCVFCCLRVCMNCFQKLQKCPNRSLTQLMENLSMEASPKELTDVPPTVVPATIDQPAT